MCTWLLPGHYKTKAGQTAFCCLSRLVFGGISAEADSHCLQSLQSLQTPDCLQTQDSCGLQEQDEHDHGHNISDHDRVKFPQREFPAAEFNFLDDPVRTDHPADQDGGQHGDEGHHETVADIIHQIQDLSYAAVGQGKLNIEDAVTQRDDDRNNSVKDRQDKGGRLPPCMEYLHAVGRDGLQYGNAAGQRWRQRLWAGRRT